MAYVEPCCCERQLPKLLRDGKMFFQTSGDVTVMHLMKSIGCMVEGKSEMWLMAEKVDVGLLRVIRHWFNRDWIATLHLLTRADFSEMVFSELAGYGVRYACDEMVRDGVLAFVGLRNLVAVQGPMLLETDFSTRMYAGVFGGRGMLDDEEGQARAMMSVMMAKMRVKERCARQ